MDAESEHVDLENAESPASEDSSQTGGATRGVAAILAVIRNELKEDESVQDSQASTSVDNEINSDTKEKEINIEPVLEEISEEKKPLSPESLENKRERRIATGMGTLLHQHRASSSVEETVVNENPAPNEENLPEIDMSKLNRKERRALMMKRKLEEGGTEVTKEEGKQDAENPQVKICRVNIEYCLENSSPETVFRESLAFQIEMPKFGFAESSFSNNYLKLAKFSPCGRFVATTSQDRNARTFLLNEEELKLSQISTIPLGDVVYDAVWHPCGDLLATSSRLHPIHLWNVHGGREATYRGINHLDELSAAQTMAFSSDGLTLYAGYNKFIRMWDVRQPGRQLCEIKTFKTKPYKQGQKAIISSIAVNPCEPGVFAAATYGSTIGLYSEKSNFSDFVFGGDFSAITHVQYSQDGVRLYGSERKSGRIFCWDTRNMGQKLFTLHRVFETNQKAYFDLSQSDQYLFAGTSDGEVAVFELQGTGVDRKPIHQRKIAECCVSCVSLHPRLPLMVACTGQRVFPHPIIDPDDIDEETVKIYVDASSTSDLRNELLLLKF